MGKLMHGTATIDDFRVLYRDEIDEYRRRLRICGPNLRQARSDGTAPSPDDPGLHAGIIASYGLDEEVPRVHGQELMRWASWTPPKNRLDFDHQYRLWGDAHLMLICLDGPTGRAVRPKHWPTETPPP
ncbi:hypothetical protein [Actinospongicola halichondriae]|uniref:hypothetical protein n=1 Tax=Actinospongicola halichondriae TaxID=3236844 RepID=UPI003D3A1FE6